MAFGKERIKEMLCAAVVSNTPWLGTPMNSALLIVHGECERASQPSSKRIMESVQEMMEDGDLIVVEVASPGSAPVLMLYRKGTRVTNRSFKKKSVTNNKIVAVKRTGRG